MPTVIRTPILRADHLKGVGKTGSAALSAGAGFTIDTGTVVGVGSHTQYRSFHNPFSAAPTVYLQPLLSRGVASGTVEKAPVLLSGTPSPGSFRLHTHGGAAAGGSYSAVFYIAVGPG